jgi:hypothetical protein
VCVCVCVCVCVVCVSLAFVSYAMSTKPPPPRTHTPSPPPRPVTHPTPGNPRTDYENAVSDELNDSGVVDEPPMMWNANLSTSELKENIHSLPAVKSTAQLLLSELDASIQPPERDMQLEADVRQRRNVLDAVLRQHEEQLESETARLHDISAWDAEEKTRLEKERVDQARLAKLCGDLTQLRDYEDSSMTEERAMGRAKRAALLDPTEQSTRDLKGAFGQSRDREAHSKHRASQLASHVGILEQATLESADRFRVLDVLASSLASQVHDKQLEFEQQRNTDVRIFFPHHRRDARRQHEMGVLRGLDLARQKFAAQQSSASDVHRVHSGALAEDVSSHQSMVQFCANV